MASIPTRIPDQSVSWLLSMANERQIRRDHSRINLDKRYSFHNRMTDFNEYGEPIHTFTPIYLRSGKRLSDVLGDGLSIELGGEGTRIITGIRLLVRYDTIFMANETFVILEPDNESKVERIEILDRKRWLILHLETST